MPANFPKVVRIESAGRCNFKCKHCPVGIHGNTREMMIIGVFKQIFDRLPIIPETLVLYHGGEPLLNKDLELLVAYAKDKGVKKVVFNTNASLLTPERAHKLACAGLDEMRVSFDGSSVKDNDNIRVGSNFWKHAPIVKQAAQMLNITIYNIKFDGDPKPANYLQDYFGDLVKYRTDLARNWAHEESDPVLIAGDKSPTYCKELFETFSIMSNGDVVTCCEDLLADYTYGNVLLETPLEIYNRTQELRNAFTKKDYPELCRHCYIVTGKHLEK